jgi:multidrug efflux pump
VVSLTLTPMMSARLLRHHRGTEEGWFYRSSGAVIDWMVAAYGRQLQWGVCVTSQ